MDTKKNVFFLNIVDRPGLSCRQNGDGSVCHNSELLKNP